MGRLRAYGNAIVPQVAAVFVMANAVAERPSNDDFSPGDAWHSVEAKEEMWGMGGEMTGPMMSTDCLGIERTRRERNH